jgi:hypothetical protein
MNFFSGTKNLMPKIIITCSVLFFLTSCSSNSETNSSTSEPVVGPSASSIKEPPSFAAFQTCFPVTAINDLKRTLEDVNEGMLSNQDLAEPLMQVSTAAGLSRMLLDGEDVYQKYPELEKVIPENKISDYLAVMDKEEIFFAKMRVKLLDSKTINLKVLNQEIDFLSNYLSPFCKID